ncbi:amidohydrolase [Sporosarcina sp. YIM B06819]|uniref:amidohydrolase n=1 Tax=Sporosarcina sp. YIM B06819 TaxID=3081769 RepID=UPI00298C58BE|nr:amidohydrolase [Sporosarcina sp. YIM B06819]
MIQTKRTVFYNAKIFTANPDALYADAFSVKDGVVEWIGNHSALPFSLEGGMNLEGRTVIPGIVDAHLHPVYVADFAKQIPCMAPVTNSIEELKERIRERRGEQQAGDWIESWGYDEGKLIEGRAPNRHDLDEACSDSPVVVTRTCAHIISVNSKALEIAGIDRNTPDPKGGQFERDENGDLTGIIREIPAQKAVKDHMPKLTQTETAKILVETGNDLVTHGITAVTEMMALHDGTYDYLEMYEEARSLGFNHDTVMYYTLDEFKKLDAATCINHEASIRIGGIKLFSDGSVSGRTAWVSEPFKGSRDEHGIATTTREELTEAADLAERYGIQLAVHAMGDNAIDLITETFADRKPWLEGKPSIRIEHAAMPTERALAIAQQTGIAFVPQSIFLFAEIESYLTNLGEGRTESSYPIKTFLERGIQTALSSDAPATSWADPVNPFAGIQSAVTRTAYNGVDTGQSECIDVETAVALYTREAAAVCGLERQGMLKTGFKANFAVLDRDLFTIPEEEIGDVSVYETYMDGEVVYQMIT